MNYGKFRIFEFQLPKLCIDPCIVMIAKRGSGKSWISRDLIHHFRKIPGGVVIAPTDRMNPFYKHFFPDLYIHYDIKDSLLKKILLRQMIMKEKSNEKKKKGLKVDPSGLLIMDDCLSRKKSWAKDESILEILMNGRHYKLTYLLTMQTPLGITPDLRLNFDYFFLLKENSSINLEKLYKNYASIFSSYNEFEKVFKICTADYKCMVIDNREQKNNIEELVFWFKAKDRNFQFGSEGFKEMHKKYYDPGFMRRQIDSLLKGSPGGNVNKKKKEQDDIRVELKE